MLLRIPNLTELLFSFGLRFLEPRLRFLLLHQQQVQSRILLIQFRQHPSQCLLRFGHLLRSPLLSFLQLHFLLHPLRHQDRQRRFHRTHLLHLRHLHRLRLTPLHLQLRQRRIPLHQSRLRRRKLRRPLLRHLNLTLQQRQRLLSLLRLLLLRLPLRLRHTQRRFLIPPLRQQGRHRCLRLPVLPHLRRMFPLHRPQCGMRLHQGRNQRLLLRVQPLYLLQFLFLLLPLCLQLFQGRLLLRQPPLNRHPLRLQPLTILLHLRHRCLQRLKRALRLLQFTAHLPQQSQLPRLRRHFPLQRRQLHPPRLQSTHHRLLFLLQLRQPHRLFTKLRLFRPNRRQLFLPRLHLGLHPIQCLPRLLLFPR